MPHPPTTITTPRGTLRVGDSTPEQVRQAMAEADTLQLSTTTGRIVLVDTADILNVEAEA